MEMPTISSMPRMVEGILKSFSTCRFAIVRALTFDIDEFYSLCDLDEGVEIRELRCRHLFHRSCLDIWLEYGKATCPLCRVPLVPCEPKAKMKGEWWRVQEFTSSFSEYGGEFRNSHLALVSNNHNGWWVC